MILTFDANFKQLFKDLLSDSSDQVAIEDNIKVGTLPLEIDLVLSGLTKIDPSEFTSVGWDFLAKITKITSIDRLVVEFKSDRDLLSVPDIYKIKAYYYLYLEKNYRTVPEDIIQSLIISTLTPVKVMKTFQFNQLEEGIYRQDSNDLFLIIINELNIEEKNYNLLMFSTGDKKLDFLVELLDKKNNPFEGDLISYAYFYYYEELEMAAESENIEIDKLSINIKKAIDRIGIKRVIEEVGIQRVIEEFGIQRVIEEFGIQRVIEEVGIQRVINEYGIGALIKNLPREEKQELLDRLKNDLEG